MNFENTPSFDTWEEMLEQGFIQSIKRKMPSGYWNELGYYHVVFWDGTTRDFSDSCDILRFANCLLQFHRDRD